MESYLNYFYFNNQMNDYKNITQKELLGIKARCSENDFLDETLANANLSAEIAKVIYILNQQRLKSEHLGEYCGIIIDIVSVADSPPKFYFDKTSDGLVRQMNTESNKAGKHAHICSVDKFIVGNLGL